MYLYFHRDIFNTKQNILFSDESASGCVSGCFAAVGERSLINFIWNGKTLKNTIIFTQQKKKQKRGECI